MAVLAWIEGFVEAVRSYLPIIIQYVALIVVALAIERIGTSKVRKAIEEARLPPEAGNAILLALRVSILVVACIVALNIGGVPSSWLVGLSALGGTAIGFASTRSVGNLISGIYIMITRPFRIGDYVRIGNLEGEVMEITMNYTKLRAPDGSILLISNQKVLDSHVTNFSVEVGGEKLIRYGFTMGFDHSVPTDELERAIRSVLEEASEGLPRRPTFELVKCDRLNREYHFTFYVRDVDELWRTRDKIMRSVLRAWEELKAPRS